MRLLERDFMLFWWITDFSDLMRRNRCMRRLRVLWGLIWLLWMLRRNFWDDWLEWKILRRKGRLLATHSLRCLRGRQRQLTKKAVGRSSGYFRGLCILMLLKAFLSG